MPGPHDLFARRVFSHPERAAAELRAVLPAEVVSRVDWSTLRRESGSVVDPELKETESDLLFSARFFGGNSVLFYLLLEHQSSVDRWMALRMLRYVVRQLEQWRKEHPGSALLPVILPLVMYHGPGGAWSAPRRVEELFDLPAEGELAEALRARVPRHEYLLDDLTAERAEALMGRPGPPLALLALLALRYGRTEELAQQLPGWMALLTQVRAAPNGLEEVSGVFHYLLLVGERSARGATVSMLKWAVGAKRTEELMLTWGEEHFEQGRQKGRSEGRAEGRAEDVLRILTARDVPVSDSDRRRILSCADVATLDRWFDRALKATRLAEVLEDVAQ